MATIVKVSCFPNEGEPQVIAGDPVLGDIVRITTNKGAVIYERYSPPPSAPTPRPVVLSATGFMDSAIQGIRAANSSTQAAAEARFQEIIEAAKNFAGATEVAKRVRYVHERYAKATTFNRAVVGGMLALFRAAGVASITAGEEAGILAAWPEG